MLKVDRLLYKMKWLEKFIKTPFITKTSSTTHTKPPLLPTLIPTTHTTQTTTHPLRPPHTPLKLPHTPLKPPHTPLKPPFPSSLSSIHVWFQLLPVLLLSLLYMPAHQRHLYVKGLSGWLQRHFFDG